MTSAYQTLIEITASQGRPDVFLRPALTFIFLSVLSSCDCALPQRAPLSYRVKGLQGLLILWLQLVDEIVKRRDDLLIDVENISERFM